MAKFTARSVSRRRSRRARCRWSTRTRAWSSRPEEKEVAPDVKELFSRFEWFCDVTSFDDVTTLFLWPFQFYVLRFVLFRVFIIWVVAIWLPKIDEQRVLGVIQIICDTLQGGEGQCHQMPIGGGRGLVSQCVMWNFFPNSLISLRHFLRKKYFRTIS